MEINQTALLDIIAELTNSLQWSVEELERLRKVLCSDPQMNQKYIAETESHVRDVSLGSIRALHQRVLAIGQELRNQV
jgi:hypothetical protein